MLDKYNSVMALLKQDNGNFKKRLIKLFTILILIANSTCYAQQLVQTKGDAQKLKTNEHLFINGPLKKLLNQIKPEIKMVGATPSKNIQSRVGYFTFKFVDFKQNDSLKIKSKAPVTIIVYVKEPFDWDLKTRPADKKFTWTKKDKEKYGNLTVVGMRVYGNN